ncbi:Protein kinase-like domain protein [Niveomyces insectorum RCEF 264]|uniref:Protein kinase-like domain protein n=1 Tax=Niveomyces insectorum RCEF 264 TaxID=1081102 RepID=A0A167U2W0_9HYPO|nr:Protein kinase-like domain protein [Niveomyces insectorum RCEF 264]
MESQIFDRHLQYLREEAIMYQSIDYSIDDKYPPRTDPLVDGRLLARKTTRYVSHYCYENVFVKRMVQAEESDRAKSEWFPRPSHADRLRNEAAALEFLAANTTIPVPKLLGLWEQDGGRLYLKTAVVKDGVEMFSLSDEDQARALPVVAEEMERAILPQLRKRRRNRIGSVDPSLSIIPPVRLWSNIKKVCPPDDEGKRTWPVVFSHDGTDEFVFCHNDLRRANILVDPTTFHIVSIIDWEMSGFFPPDWDVLFYKANTQLEYAKMTQAVLADNLALFSGAGQKYLEPKVEDNKERGDRDRVE